MSDLLEIVLEIVLEGALHGASSRRVPLVVRALLAAVLAALWLGLSGLLLYVGMQSGSIPLMFCGGLFLAKNKERKSAEAPLPAQAEHQA